MENALEKNLIEKVFMCVYVCDRETDKQTEQISKLFNHF